jgi:uncharacterized protein YdeI (YjbR/CyaY-like superfamily)
MAVRNEIPNPDRLAREVYPMPEDVRAALDGRALMDRYRARPAYQQNDYVGWITRARRPQTRRKRLDQMLGELEQGGVYMKMAWHSKQTESDR